MASPSTTPAAPTAATGLLSPSLDGLGVTFHDGGGTLRVWSAHATSMELVLFDADDLDWATETFALDRVEGDVWQVTTRALRPGVHYAVRADGPSGHGDMFNAESLLLDPYARGLVSGGVADWRGVAVDGAFEWGGVAKPGIPMARTVLYEAHVKGVSKRHPDVPPALHGTYAGLAHPAMIDHFQRLGVTSIELLPIHAFASEPRIDF